MNEPKQETQGIHPDQWIAEGYRKHNVNPIIGKNADYLLQKLFKDNVGKRYYLTAYVYENYNKDWYAQYESALAPYSYAPDVQFSPEGECTMNVQLLMGNDTRIQDVEQQVYDLWVNIGKPYYELWS